MSECPLCHTEIGKSNYCGCGWKKKSWRGSEKKSDPFPLQCSWLANSERCNYPGAHSHNTTGGGPWYCGVHDTCKDPILGAQIVEASRKYRPVNSLVKLQLEMETHAAQQRLVHHIPKGGRNWALRNDILIKAGLLKTTLTVQRFTEEVLRENPSLEKLPELELKLIEVPACV